MLLISDGRMPWISWLGDVSSSPIMSQQSIFTSHSEIFRSRLAAAFSSFAARALSLGDAELHHNTSAGCFVQFQATFSNFFYCCHTDISGVTDILSYKK